MLPKWGAISTEGKAYLQPFTGTMKAKYYKELLEKDFIPEANQIMPQGVWILQQDEAFAHTAKSVTRFLDSYKILILEWPSRSPDLNPMENIWGILKKKVYRRNPETFMELENAIFEEWDLLDNNEVGRIAASFPSHLRQVIDRHGSVIDY